MKQTRPPHPGEVLREYLADIPVAAAARAMGISRSTLSRIVRGETGVSVDMSIRLGRALGTSAELWAGMQLRFDLYRAARMKRTKIKRLVARAKGGSVLELKGMFEAPAGVKVSIKDMRVKLPSIK